jgi:predicted Zn-dependent protease
MAKLTQLALVALMGGALFSPAFAADTKAPEAEVIAETAAPTYEGAQAAIAAEDFTGAARMLAQLAVNDPQNADVWNLFGYSSRKMGQMGAAAQAYEMALSLNPDHIGALEYQGEMFVELKKPEDAAKNLAKLQSLCGDCEQALELEALIAAMPAVVAP